MSLGSKFNLKGFIMGILPNRIDVASSGFDDAKSRKGSFSPSVAKGLVLAGVLTLGASATTLEEAAGGFTVDISPIFVMMAVILTAIGGIWAVKKMISLGNKS